MPSHGIERFEKNKYFIAFDLMLSSYYMPFHETVTVKIHLNTGSVFHK